MMARQGQNFVIPARWVKLAAAFIAVCGVLGPAGGVGVTYIARDTTQSNKIESLEKKFDRIDERLSHIEQLLMERK